jgi:fatty acid desaturase
MKLHRLVRNPKPQNRLEQWIDRHTTERNALYIALIGLFLAVLFGFLGLIVGIIQTWITYKAWKYPQPVPSG